MDEFDVLILGAGLAGTTATLRAAELGGKVCLIEKGNVGKLGFKRRNALFMEDYQPLLSSKSWKEYKGVLDRVSDEYSGALKEKIIAAGVSIISGEGRLVSQGEVSVQKEEGDDLLLRGKSVILAHGSSPRYPATLPYEEGVVISVDDIPQLPGLPDKVLILGGGSFASETAFGLQRRGCKVFLCCEQKELFPELDEDFNFEIESQFKANRIKVLAGKKLVSFYKSGTDLEITLETGIKLSVDQIIIADDRCGGQADYADHLGIRLGDHHKILVDDSMMTSLPGVYAIGGATGELTSGTLSQDEGRVAAENALGIKRKLNREWVPQIVRLPIRTGYVGCSMKTACQQGFHPIEGKFDGDIPGGGNQPDLRIREKYKIIADKRSRLIVGVQIISDLAPDWIPMLLLMFKKGVTVGNLANSIALEGSKIEGLFEAAKDCSQALKSA